MLTSDCHQDGLSLGLYINPASLKKSCTIRNSIVAALPDLFYKVALTLPVPGPKLALARQGKTKSRHIGK